MIVPMYRIVALVLSPFVMGGLFYAFGVVAVLLCFAALLATVIFSSGPDEEHAQHFASTEGLGDASTYMGGL